jgi:hypothetical protein
LFDLVFDPSETNNLIANPEYAAVKEELQTRLYQWMTDTDDILLHENPIQPPSGAILNHVDQLSPNETVITFD